MKYLIKLFIIALFTTVVGTKAYAQTPQYSQFHLTPLLTNPSAAAMSNYAMVSGGYRSQAVSGNQGIGSFLLQLSYPFMRKTKTDTVRSSYAGLMVVNDNTGPNGVFNTLGFAGSFGYNVRFTPEHKLAFGLQVGVYQRKIDDSRLRSGSQFSDNTGSYDPNMPLNDNITTTLVTYPGINAGLTYYKEDPYGDIKYYLGASATNLNKPNYSFFQDKGTNAPINYTVTGGFNAVNTEKVTITPNARYWSIDGKQYQVNAGSLFYLKTKGSDKNTLIGEGNVGLGAWYSINNAAILSLEINQPNFSFGVAYDYVTSNLNTNSAQARAIEFILTIRKFRGYKKRKSAPTTEVMPDTLVKPLPMVKKDTVVTPVAPIAPPVQQVETPAPVVITEKPEVIKPEPVVKAPVVKKAKKGKAKKVKRKLTAAEKEANDELNAATKSAGSKTGGSQKGKMKSKDSFRNEKGFTKADLAILKLKPKFNFNSVELTPNDIAILDKVETVLAKYPDLRITLTGHTCNIGSSDINEKVGAFRADKGKDYLVSKGISADRIETSSAGETEPRFSNDTFEGRRKNRRIEFAPIN